jgi:hypothetical protein
VTDREAPTKLAFNSPYFETVNFVKGILFRLGWFLAVLWCLQCHYCFEDICNYMMQIPLSKQDLNERLFEGSDFLLSNIEIYWSICRLTLVSIVCLFATNLNYSCNHLFSNCLLHNHFSYKAKIKLYIPI